MNRVKQIRSLTGLSQAKFSEQYNIPKRTLENWETDRAKCPTYVIDLLEYKVIQDYKKISKN